MALTGKEIAKNLMSDVNSYSEFIETMLEKHLESNPQDKIYWDAWFRGATGKTLEDADRGIKLPDDFNSLMTEVLTGKNNSSFL